MRSIFFVSLYRKIDSINHLLLQVPPNAYSNHTFYSKQKMESCTFVEYTELCYPYYITAYLQYNGNEDVLHRLNTLLNPSIKKVGKKLIHIHFRLNLDKILTYNDMLELSKPKLNRVEWKNKVNVCLTTQRIVMLPGKIDFPFLEKLETYDLKTKDGLLDFENHLNNSLQTHCKHRSNDDKEDEDDEDEDDEDEDEDDEEDDDATTLYINKYIKYE
jgi:hypothetical protein